MADRILKWSGTSTTGLQDVDKGYRAIIESMARAAGHPDAHVVVGWPERTGGATHAGGGGMTIAEIAAVHEFGVPARGIPERSMLRGSADANQAKYVDMVRKIANGVTRGRATLRQGLDILGVAAKADVQERMAEGIQPALKKVVKGRETPLVNTGQLKGAIDHEVRGC